MYNWKLMCSNEQAYEGLHEELLSCRGKYILEMVQLPDTCGNAVTNIEFLYYSDREISITHTGNEIEYTGNNPQIAGWINSGRKDFNSFSELTSFLLLFKDDCIIDIEHCSDDDREIDDVPERPVMRYDKSKVIVPKNNKYLSIDKDRLILDLNSEVFGQVNQVRAIASLVADHISTKKHSRPLSIFLYGPTGVGKSQVCESLVKAINHQVDKNHRFNYRPIDCGQMMDKSSVTRITGAPPSYVGFDEPGLFSILEENPRCCFVVEEIEKAHPSVCDTLLLGIDSGRIETPGKTLKNGAQYWDLTQSILFFTSNITLDDKKTSLGFSADDETEPNECENNMSSDSLDNINFAREIGKNTRIDKERLAATGRFRQEMVGRFDAIVRFDNISDEAVCDIAAKVISDLAAKDHLIYITSINERLLQEFINVCSDEVNSFGVRSLKSEAKYFFADTFREFSHNNEDYCHASVSGTLDDIEIELDEE